MSDHTKQAETHTDSIFTALWAIEQRIDDDPEDYNSGVEDDIRPHLKQIGDSVGKLDNWIGQLPDPNEVEAPTPMQLGGWMITLSRLIDSCGEDFVTKLDLEQMATCLEQFRPDP